MSGRKLGEGTLQKMGELGLFELRNAASFEGSNVQDDIRRAFSDSRLQQYPAQAQSPDSLQQQSQLELQQEQSP